MWNLPLTEEGVEWSTSYAQDESEHFITMPSDELGVCWPEHWKEAGSQLAIALALAIATIAVVVVVVVVVIAILLSSIL